MHCTKMSPEFESGVKGQRSRSPRTKNKTAESSPLRMHNNACAVGRTQQAATDDTTAWLPGGDGVTAVDDDGYAGGKISACCLVIQNIFLELSV